MRLQNPQHTHEQFVPFSVEIINAEVCKGFSEGLIAKIGRLTVATEPRARIKNRAAKNGLLIQRPSAMEKEGRTETGCASTNNGNMSFHWPHGGQMQDCLN